MTTIAISPLIFLILILAIGAFVGVAARRARVVRPDHHHWLVRVLCAVLALAALVAVGVGTWRGTGTAPVAKPVLVTLPAAPPPPVAEAKDTNGSLDLGPMKLIGTVLLVRKIQEHYLPVCGESLAIDWPPVAGDELVFRGQAGDASYKVTMPLRGFVKWNLDDEIRTHSGVRIETQGKRWSRSGGMELKLGTLMVEEMGGVARELLHAPLSILPTVASDDLRLLILLTRADRNDPLRQVAAGDWLAGEAKALRRDERTRHSSQGMRFDPATPPGIRMLAFLGPAAVLLLLAAGTGSAMFPRGWRAVGFAGLMAGMVLYAGALDALAMQRRARVATAASEPMSLRLAALESIRHGTFFHPGAATEKLRQIAADPASPPDVRAVAANLADE